ncbi:DUF2252 family protein [Streptomyces diastaticus]|uniref:Cyclase n=1 Tax=Streptomyces diastaticus subsp. diastaticus TaxID=68040 RepID=A0ABQ1CJF1_STRDI|nr:hypothetical protein Srut_12110 [Streptomyces rutgersensis]GFH70277.1 hypothetical protein Sdia_10450 [Streptomyces diastaticus subsp. diastaticus]GGU16335.1 hypothetical protein GCM10015534_18900 [Streptomyces diastaticus subsp. diastaticus]
MDLDDFDETAHGPWEGDLKRLGRRASAKVRGAMNEGVAAAMKVFQATSLVPTGREGGGGGGEGGGAPTSSGPAEPRPGPSDRRGGLTAGPRLDE